jgi:DNA-binding NarL/FixJ family response regulator
VYSIDHGPAASSGPPASAAQGVDNRIGASCAVCHSFAVTSVLIVDDHPSFRATARALLETEGLDVVGEAEDGLSALAAVERLHPQVVLLDVHLPDIDGFEVASRLAADGDGGPRVILVSSHDVRDFGRLVARSGAVGFIPKAELSGAAIAELIG